MNYERKKKRIIQDFRTFYRRFKKTPRFLAGASYSMVRLWRTMQYHCIRLFGKEVTISTKQGIFTFSSDHEDGVGSCLYIDRHYEMDLMDSIARFLRDTKKKPPKEKGTILDIGANIGPATIGFLTKGAFLNAIAIEPEPRNFQLLKKNLEHNKLLDRVICLPYAVSDNPMTADLELNPDDYGANTIRMLHADHDHIELFGESKRQTIKVKADTIDNLLKQVPPTPAGEY